MKFNTELYLENAYNEYNKLRIFPDNTDIDLIGISISLEDELIKLNNKEPSFHLDKTQVGILISYLQAIHNEME